MVIVFVFREFEVGCLELGVILLGEIIVESEYDVDFRGPFDRHLAH